jgi:hypothetical protein
MRLPVLRGVIERRILVNYRVQPEVLAALLPSPFRPQVVDGFGLAGICLIRLGQIRPRGLPPWIGVRSENVAHRVAVKWDDDGTRRQGVYIFRRDTNSSLNAMAGGRLFPGVHHRAAFRVRESNHRFDLTIRNKNQEVLVQLDAELTPQWPVDSVFGSLAQASAFFERGSVGYSPGANAGEHDGLELKCRTWIAEPLKLNRVSSSYFDDKRRFPDGSIELDCGLLMRDIEHEWQARRTICCASNEFDVCPAAAPTA